MTASFQEAALGFSLACCPSSVGVTFPEAFSLSDSVWEASASWGRWGLLSVAPALRDLCGCAPGKVPSTPLHVHALLTAVPSFSLIVILEKGVFYEFTYNFFAENIF